MSDHLKKKYLCGLLFPNALETYLEMTIEEIKNLVNGEVICGNDYLDHKIDHVFASDLMSDVLTLKDINNLLLLTGLSNLQSIRTCEMSDINYILIVRGKEVTEEMQELAEENDMVIIRTQYSMYKTAGLLYNAGLPAVY